MSTNHEKFVHRQLLIFFAKNTIKMTEDDAKQLIKAIAKEKSPYIKINY